MKNDKTLSFSRRNLPHWFVTDAAYFVTIRLKGSIPKNVAEEIQSEITEMKKTIENPDDIIDLERLHFNKMEAILDSCKDSPIWLGNEEVARLIRESADWLAGRGWRYFGVVMPNHLHLLMVNKEGRSAELSKDLGQFKNFTAKEANRILQRKGSFWLPENFDHWCRNQG